MSSSYLRIWLPACQLSADLQCNHSYGCLHRYCSLPLNLESGLLSLGQALLQPPLLADGRTRQARAWHQQLAGCAAVACEVSSAKPAGILVVAFIVMQSTLYLLLPSSYIVQSCHPKPHFCWAQG